MILRIFIVISFLVSLGAAVISFANYNSYRKEHIQRLDMEAKLMQAQDLAAANKTEIEQQKAQIAELNNQIEISKKSERDLKALLSAKELENQGLKNSSATLNVEIHKLKEQVENYKRKERIPSPILKPTDAAAATAASENLKIPTGADAVIPTEAPPSNDSRILTVNRKFNFIVVNLGLRDGLRMGDKVKVMKADKQIALAQIEKIYDKFSAATLLNEDQGNQVHEGDTVHKA